MVARSSVPPDIEELLACIHGRGVYASELVGRAEPQRDPLAELSGLRISLLEVRVDVVDRRAVAESLLKSLVEQRHNSIHFTKRTPESRCGFVKHTSKLVHALGRDLRRKAHCLAPIKASTATTIATAADDTTLTVYSGFDPTMVPQPPDIHDAEFPASPPGDDRR